MQRTWVALHRRSDADLPVQVCFDNVFTALLGRSLGAGIAIPETVIFGHIEHRYFHYDAGTGTVQCTPSSLTTTRAIVEAFVGDVPPGLEHSRIVAVWYSERKDTRGMIVAAEYFTASALVSFFDSGERRKMGVLQRFVYPRLRKGTQDVNNELVAHWASGGDVEVQRFFASASNRLDAGDIHPTLRATVLPPVAVVGKVAAMTLPLAPADIAGPHAEAVEVPTFLQHVGGLCGRVQSWLEAASDHKHHVRTFTALLKFGREDSQLYFCGLLALRLSFGPSFELVKVPRPSASRPRIESANAEFDVTPISHNAYHAYIPAPTRLQRSPPRDERVADDIAGSEPLSYLHPRDPLGHFACPNCGVVVPKDEFVAVPYRNIVAHTNRRNAWARRELEDLLPRPRPETWVYRPSSAKPATSRPLSARVASSVEAARSLPDDAACFRLGQEWADVPPVLKKLSVPLDEVSTRPSWMGRCASLCGGCAAYFAAAERVSPRVSPARRGNAAAAAAELKAPAAASRREASPPPFLRSEIIDQIVVTDLQRAHRKQRREERTKYEMRQVIKDARTGSGAVGRADRAEREAEALLVELSATSAPLGIGADTPPAIVLANELHSAMQLALSRPRDITLRASSAAAQQRPLPPPPFLVDVAMANNDALAKSKAAAEHLAKGRAAAHRALRCGSTTFADLDESERRLLIDVVGEDTTRVLDDDYVDE